MSTGWLEDRLQDPALTVIEVSADLPGEAAYEGGHIPGSRYAYWKDLLWHDTDREFAGAATLAGRLGRLGASNEATIALVGDPVQFAAYAFWVLTMRGLGSRVVLVDGGRDKWIAEGRPTTDEVPDPVEGRLDAGDEDSSPRIGRDEVLEGLMEPSRLLIDVRSPEEYRGDRVSPSEFEVDHGAQRMGRIPGARHLYYQDLLTPEGAYRDPEEIRERLAGLQAESSEVVLYCRLSHRATLVWFAMKYLLGLDRVRVYDGSWTEWGSIVGFPIER